MYNYKIERQKKIDDMMDDPGYLHCEMCKRSQAPRYHTHHILYRSSYPKHPQLHNPLNLIILCETCHTWIHASKPRGETLIKERGLKELFVS